MRDRGRYTTAVAAGASALLLLDVTAVNVALPSIATGISAGFDQLQWVVDAYALSLSVVLLTAGAAADRYGRRRVFLVGIAVFAAASLACGLTGSPLLLDLTRIVQGAGAAAMFACSLALLANEYSGAARGRALGIWGAVTGGSLALGPLVGGLLVDGLGWRSIFLINLPLCALLAWATVAGARESSSDEAPGLDPAGVATFSLAGFALVYGLIRGNADGWTSTPIVVAFLLGALSLLAFFAAELRSRSPMLDLSLFRIPSFSGTALVAFAQSFALYPLFLFLAVYFQGVLGFSATGTGLRLLPLTLVLFAVAPISGALTGRVQLRWLLSLGLAMIGAGLLLMRSVDATSEWTVFIPGFAVGGAGIGVISPALAAAMVGVLSDEESGLASGINNTFRQLGIAVGIAVLGAIFQHRLGVSAVRRSQLAERADFVEALRAIFLVSSAVALVAVPATLALVRIGPASGDQATAGAAAPRA